MNLGERIIEIWAHVTSSSEMTIATAVSVLVFAVLYYYMIKFLFDNNSGALVSLFVFIMLISAGILTFISNINSAIYLIIPAIFVIAIIILYSVEIKRLLWSRRSLKLADVKHGDGISYDEEKIQNCISEIIKALQNMSKNDVGAIIVLSTGNVPNQILDSGVRLDSDISSELIESVFFPNTPLHDGAMIINGTKIVATGCFLPLSQNIDKIPKDLGTRHRAGIGVTETLDVMSFIVSEETGIISVARAGQITRYADTEILKRTLGRYYWQELESARK
ncbi:MAG: DNA integrity scanning protein DisA nucleotide-binding domain protein [Clostridia bacterium]|nr:DNA integrity scanning protein DisA nucleotide-binding domain protein [Clostridia bacterium]